MAIMVYMYRHTLHITFTHNKVNYIDSDSCMDLGMSFGQNKSTNIAKGPFSDQHHHVPLFLQKKLRFLNK